MTDWRRKAAEEYFRKTSKGMDFRGIHEAKIDMFVECITQAEPEQRGLEECAGEILGELALRGYDSEFFTGSNFFPAILKNILRTLAPEDNPEFDGTDAAHPAWWRGEEHGVGALCQRIKDILDGKEKPVGVAKEPWESTRRRLHELAKAPEAHIEAAAYEIQSEFVIPGEADKKGLIEILSHHLRDAGEVGVDVGKASEVFASELYSIFETAGQKERIPDIERAFRRCIEQGHLTPIPPASEGEEERAWTLTIGLLGPEPDNTEDHESWQDACESHYEEILEALRTFPRENPEPVGEAGELIQDLKSHASMYPTPHEDSLSLQAARLLESREQEIAGLRERVEELENAIDNLPSFPGLDNLRSGPFPDEGVKK